MFCRMVRFHLTIVNAHKCCGVHVCMLNMQVWSPKQCAQAIVESGLHYVDALAIANCVAQQILGNNGIL